MIVYFLDLTDSTVDTPETVPYFRTTNPELLHKKDRGRPTEAVVVMKRKGFGEGDVFEHVPGAEVLDLEEPEVSEPPVRAGKRKRGDDEDEDDSGMEVDDEEEEVRSI